VIVKRTGVRFIILCVAVLYWPASLAELDNSAPLLHVDVILSHDTSEYHSIYQAITNNITSSNADSPIINYHLVDQYPPTKKSISKSTNLIVAIGTTATRKAFSLSINVPILSIFIPKTNYISLKNTSNNIVSSAIVLDQPIERYLRLIKLLFPYDDLKIGLFDDADNTNTNHIHEKFSLFGLLPTIENVKGVITIRNIEKVINSSDVILLLPEYKYISPHYSKWILYMAYLEKKPIISFSKPYLNSGALGVIFTDPESIGRQAAKYILDIKASKLLPISYFNSMNDFNYPDSYSYSINEKTARAMKVPIPNDQHIKDTINGNK